MSWRGQLIDRVVAVLQDRRNPAGTAQRWWRRARWLLAAATGAYLAALVVVLALLHWWGETSLLLSLPLYLPAWGWAWPAFVLLPLALLVRPRLCLPLLAGIVLVGGPFMDCRWHRRQPGTAGLRVLTYNYGQRQNTEVHGFAAQVDADVIALQDAALRESKYRTFYPERHVAGVGEFILISRHPVTRTEALVADPATGRPVGARFELSVAGQPVAVYSLHLPTPRREFIHLRGDGILRGWRHGTGIWDGATRAEYREFLAGRRELAGQLAARFDAEPLPCVVVGDLNVAPHGTVYRQLRGGRRDAFQARGAGYGYTFPGFGAGLASFRQPWLRLDYILCSRHWQVEDFVTERGRPAQHLAVFARLTLKAGGAP